MSKNLTIILGAGASTGAVIHGGTGQSPVIPPITKEIFDTRFDDILRKYEDVKGLTVNITHEVEDGKSLEDYLRNKLRTLDEYESLPPHRKSELNQLPLYLQDLFSTLSQKLKIETLYSRLASELFDRDINVTFMTLNYDLLLDYALERVIDNKFTDFHNYISAPNKWALFKIHGSVNWFRQIMHYSQTGNTLDSWKAIAKKINVLKDLSSEIKFIDVERDFKEGFANGIPYYPALAIPNTDYRPIFPGDNHRELMESRLQECDNFLIIGFSAYDLDMLNILKDNVKRVKKLLIVGSNDVDSVYKRLATAAPIFSGLEGPKVQYGTGFSSFMKRGQDISNFLEALREF